MRQTPKQPYYRGGRALAERSDLVVHSYYDRPGRFSGPLGGFLRGLTKSMTASALTYWPHPSPSVRVWEGHVDYGAYDNWHLFDSLIERELIREAARLAGRLAEERPLPAFPAEVPPQVRALFGPDQDTLTEIVGEQVYDGQGRPLHWQPGVAGLTPQEAQAFRLLVERDFDMKEIARHMNPKMARFGESMPLETVYQYLYRARLKLRALFGAGAPGGTSQLMTSLPSSTSSTAMPGTSAPDTKTPKTSLRTPSSATSSEASSYLTAASC